MGIAIIVVCFFVLGIAIWLRMISIFMDKQQGYQNHGSGYKDNKAEDRGYMDSVSSVENRHVPKESNVLAIFDV